MFYFSHVLSVENYVNSPERREGNVLCRVVPGCRDVGMGGEAVPSMVFAPPRVQHGAIV